MTTTVVGVFNSEAAAQNAVTELRTAGVPMDNISVIARPAGDILNEQGEVVSVADDDHMTAGEGLTVGAVWGGLVGLAALAIPGIGPLVTSNVFAAALTGAVAGAATGGIAGALIDAASVPEEHAQLYEDRVRSGGTLVTAQVDDAMAMQARSILQTSGAEEFNWDDPSTFNRSGSGGVESDEQAYAESSKVGTVGGGAAGAMTGAAIGAAGGPVGAVIGGVAGALAGGSVGAVGDTVGEKSEDAVYGDANRTADSARYSADAVTQPEYISAQMELDRNNLDNAGYVAGGMSSSTSDTMNDAESDYADSSKVGTVGGGAAGAMTGAAMGAAGGPVGAVIGGIAGAVVGGSTGAVGDTLGEKAEDSVQNDYSSTDRTTSSSDYSSSNTDSIGSGMNSTGTGNVYPSVSGGSDFSSGTNTSSSDYASTSTMGSSGDRTVRADSVLSNTADRVGDNVRDAVTDDQGDDTFRAADQAYDESSKVGTGGGALAGAATGAAIGSAGGPIGTVIGGVAGAISGAAAGAIGDTIGEEADSGTGAFSDDNKAQYRNTASNTGNRVEDALDTDLDRDGDVGRRG